MYGYVLLKIFSLMAPVSFFDCSGFSGRPVIFAANHYSAIDPYLFGLVPGDMAFVTTWPFRIPFYSAVMKAAGYVQAENGWKHVIEKSKKLLERGCSMIIWPEGHRSRDGKMGRFTNGAFIMAFLTGTPVVPVCLIGSDVVMSPGKKLLRPGRIKVVLLPPFIPSSTGYDPEGIVTMREDVRQAIADELVRNGVEPERVLPRKRRASRV